MYPGGGGAKAEAWPLYPPICHPRDSYMSNSELSQIPELRSLSLVKVGDNETEDGGEEEILAPAPVVVLVIQAAAAAL
ncbi:hypothetical protein BC829DRAFT_116480 [Chytridium lagenaria]|nr:hypothetical protein BC829DRAFT_116480 [Chytridium lagenaria]